MAAGRGAQRLEERQRFRAQLTTTILDEDRFAVYHDFVQWTVQNYSPDDPNSGLLELLEESTRMFMDNDAFKADPRYLNLWSLYAQEVDKPCDVFKFCAKREIGTMWSQLYEEYARALEMDGFRSDAERVYRTGIRRGARPVERLKTMYQDFRNRPSVFPLPSTLSLSRAPHPIRHNPLNNHLPANVGTTQPSTKTPDHNRYAVMLAPPAPGKRRERLCFNLSLLFTPEGVEYSGPEARARSLGLLGKKWGPLPSTLSTSKHAVRVKVDNDGKSNSTTSHDSTGTRRKSTMNREPTVTINTKEALADVFGMYNSPDKTVLRLDKVAGSKHAPVKTVEPVTPSLKCSDMKFHPIQSANENGDMPKTPAFRPFRDENAGTARKENPTTTPHVNTRTPFITPNPVRRALSLKETSMTPTALTSEGIPNTLTAAPEGDSKNLFSKVFTPKSFRDVCTEDREASSPSRPQEDFNVFRVEPTAEANATFTPYADAKTQMEGKALFKVFSRPDNAFIPKVGTAFRPFVDGERDILATRFAPKRAMAQHTATPVGQPEVQEDAFSDRIALAAEASSEEAQESLQEPDTDAEPASEPYRVPLGGRFGQFNVMTPITERTFEFTMSTRADSGTPRSPFFDAHVAIQSAERLAEELKAEEDRDEIVERSFVQGEEDEESFASFDEQRHVPPLEFEDGRDGSDDEDEHVEPAMVMLEEKTGSLSLIDGLTISSTFRPSNPCNPFDPPIMATLLSLVLSDAGYHDLKDQEVGLLDSLQKFAQKRRKMSGNSTSNLTLDFSQRYMAVVADRRFEVREKLGEGAFGSVFAAKDVTSKLVLDEDDDYDMVDEDDEDGDSSMVALKVVRPRNLWEYHVLRRLHVALPPNLRRSIVTPHSLYSFRDESVLVLDLSSQGTLLDIVNRASQAGVSQQGACLDELLVMFFTIELLHLLEGMHRVGFIHGDMKIDNCLLRLEDVSGGATAWSSAYQPLGQGGWCSKGIKVIDFGRTIDTRLFPHGQRFIAEWKVDARDCVEMREDRPWTFQTDYFGLAGIVYCMLYGKYIESSSVTAWSPDAGRYKISTPFKRYWQGDIWSRLFDLLLNPCLIRPDGQLPLCDELGALRREMETWLEKNCNRTGNTLKGLLKKIELCVLR